MWLCMCEDTCMCTKQVECDCAFVHQAYFMLHSRPLSVAFIGPDIRKGMTHWVNKLFGCAGGQQTLEVGD